MGVNKKWLKLIYENLLWWIENFGGYDLIGVDIIEKGFIVKVCKLKLLVIFELLGL